MSGCDDDLRANVLYWVDLIEMDPESVSEFQQERDERDDEFSASSIFCEALDGYSCIGFQGDYRGTTLIMGVGGPHVEIEAHRNTVCGYWGGSKVEVSYTDTVGLADLCAEMWGARQ